MYVQCICIHRIALYVGTILKLRLHFWDTLYSIFRFFAFDETLNCNPTLQVVRLLNLITAPFWQYELKTTFGLKKKSNLNVIPRILVPCLLCQLIGSIGSIGSIHLHSPVWDLLSTSFIEGSDGVYYP